MKKYETALSWELLQLELLEKIYGFLPKILLRDVGLVCSHWAHAVHHCAVKYLTSCIESGCIVENQLERFGWRTSAAWDHDNNKCSCVYLATHFFRKESFVVHGISQDCLEGKNVKISATVSDKIIYRVIDNDSKVSLHVINRLDSCKQSKVLALPIEQQERRQLLRDLHMGSVQIVGWDNLLAVLFNGSTEKGKLFLWDGKEETWLEDIDISLMIQNCQAFDIAIANNLLAVTATFEDSQQKTLFWQVNTSQPDATPPHFLGKVTFPNKRLVNFLINENWFGIWYYVHKELVIIKKTKLFSTSLNQAVVKAQVVDPQQPENPWQLMKLNDMDYFHVNYVSLEPGTSNRLAVKASMGKSPFDKRFQIFNLATGVVIHQVSLGINMHPACWWAGTFIFLKILAEGRFGSEQEIQVMVFDPSGSRICSTVELLETEEACFLPGPTVKYSGATNLSFSKHSMDMSRIDYYGLVLVESPSLFIASFD
jgi:hypothetical protein